jgi:hypothetical protein
MCVRSIEKGVEVITVAMSDAEPCFLEILLSNKKKVLFHSVVHKIQDGNLVVCL